MNFLSLPENRYSNVKLRLSFCGIRLEVVLLIALALASASWLGILFLLFAVYIHFERGLKGYRKLPSPVPHGNSFFTLCIHLNVKGIPDQFFKDYYALTDTKSLISLACPRNKRVLFFSLQRLSARKDVTLRFIDANFVSLEHSIADIELSKQG